MGILEAIIRGSVKNRVFVIIGVLGFIGLGVWSFQRMTFDAFPDLTNVQVQILTSSPGMAPEEVEQLVTVPVERSLMGIPGLVEMRSLSRTGVSAITVVFEDGTDIWLARQLVQERLNGARDEIPEFAGTPEIAPPSTGLGEVYQFTVTSDRHTGDELYRLLERDIGPRLRAVDGVVEVNVWGAGAPQFTVRLDPFRLASYGIPVGQVEAKISEATGVSAGGAVVEGSEQTLVRGLANPAEVASLGDIELKPGTNGRPPVLLGDVATIEEESALTMGLGSADAKGEAMFVMVQLLAGADALRVVGDVREKVEEIRGSLPDGVELEPIYDREKLVGSTLKTVTFSLLEGGALVILVLLVLLGDLRAGLLVASVIPLSMLGAFTGMYFLGYSGNLMSLGAIDFGLIVDGTIVVVESIVALELAQRGHLGQAVVKRARKVARPVFFAVSILLLVYMPILLMWGTEGKLFRPMALTVLLALFTALVLSFTYIPALASWIIKPKGEHQTWAVKGMLKAYRPALRSALAHPWIAGAMALVLIAASVLVASRLGIEFVPRLEEGDLVVQTARLPSLSREQALRESTRVEAVLAEFPEVERVASRTGSPALATDPMGMEEADILVRLKPKDEWTTAETLDGLVEAISTRLEAEAPGAEFNFTQPIEMRFNELLEGITADVGVTIYGPDLGTLNKLAQDVARTLEGVEGASDVTPPAAEGLPSVAVVVDENALARYGLESGDALQMVSAVQRGLDAGNVTRGQFRDPVRVRLDIPDGVPVEDLPLVLGNGHSIPLGEVAEVVRTESPNTVRRAGGSRRVVVTSNVRGRDLGGFVQDAHSKIAEMELPDGYWIEWSGKYEQLSEAATRTGIMLPIVLFLILGVLYIAFHSFRPALLIFLNVPAAASGGIFILWLRGLPISMSAIVGFIALFGIAVMNGIVLISRTRELHAELGAEEAARLSALERFRPVLMTATVAGIGFLPMAIATGVGAEVQRPLATVVIGGLITSTLLTLLVLPALYARVHRNVELEGDDDGESEPEAEATTSGPVPSPA